MRLEQLKERLDVVNTKATEIRTKAETETRDLTADEAEELDGLMGEFTRVKANIDRLTLLDEQTAILQTGTGRRTAPEQPAALEELGEPGDVAITRPQPAPRPTRTGGAALAVPAQPRRYAAAAGNWNFRSLGDFALSVKRATTRQGSIDPRLDMSERLAASTYGSEGVGTDGGFAVPPDFRTAVMAAVMGEDELAPRCDQVTVSGNNFTCPVDMTTPWQSSGGILAYWGNEAGTMSQSKPKLEDNTVKLNKLYALVPMTDELLDDASAMDAYLRRKAPEKIAFAVTLAIVQGEGNGKPLGILNSGCLVSVAKESSQVADTLVGNNILKMYSRMYGPSRSKAVWLINQDIEPQLLKLSMAGTDNTGNAVTGWGGLVYTPANGFSAAPYGTLFGRPVIPTQACETIGDQGDIFFVDMSQYLLLLKGGVNPRVDVSMHLWFDQDLTAFRFVLRVGGQPWWNSTIAARDGSATYSPFVTLDSR